MLNMCKKTADNNNTCNSIAAGAACLLCMQAMGEC